MGTIADHPTVRSFRARVAAGATLEPPRVLDAGWLRGVCLEVGADDVGLPRLMRLPQCSLPETSRSTSRSPHPFPGSTSIAKGMGR
jgi:hypothetical protein